MVVAGEKTEVPADRKGVGGRGPGTNFFSPQIPQNGNVFSQQNNPTSVPSFLHDIPCQHSRTVSCLTLPFTHPCLEDLTRLPLAMASNFCHNSERLSWVKARCTNKTAGLCTVLTADPITTNMPACFLSIMHMNEAKDGELLTQDDSRKHNVLINITYTP